MAYIGRGTDSISNVEVLDNITFSGASSYTLQKGSANYVPISAANILVSIDGVVQANNFSVNGSTIDFGVAIANTSTCNFILHYGVGLVTTVQDGAITSTKLGSSSVTSAKMASNSIATASIIDDAVNYAKIQDVSQSNRLLGAETAGTIAEVQVNTNMIADAQVDESKLKISNAPTNGYFLSAQSGGSGGMTWAEAGGGGKVLQVVSAIKTDRVQTTSTSATTTGLSVAITPSATSSKVLLLCNIGSAGNSGNNNRTYFAFNGGNTATFIGNAATGNECAAAFTTHRADYGQSSANMMYLDSPNTTSATTYSLYFWGDTGTTTLNGSHTVNAENGNAASSITAIEIGA